MIKMRDKWAIMVDVTNVCEHQCTYCVKHVRHLRPDQFKSMTIPDLETAIISVRDFPGKICFTGGEPLRHPEPERMMSMIRDLLPKDKVGLFTSSKTQHEKFRTQIDQTFGLVFVNYHDKDQQNVCLHQPTTLAVGDMVEDREMQQSLIAACWCNEMWSPIIGPTGAFFCDCAAGWDVLFGMGGGWPATKNWWDREGYVDQMNRYCHLCGICVPYPRQLQSETREKITPVMLSRFESHRLRNLDNFEVISSTLSAEDIKANLIGWEPWHNRQDRGNEGPQYENK